jgi:hypothetical protein
MEYAPDFPDGADLGAGRPIELPRDYWALVTLFCLAATVSRRFSATAHAFMAKPYERFVTPTLRQD